MESLASKAAQILIELRKRRELVVDAITAVRELMQERSQKWIEARRVARNASRPARKGGVMDDAGSQ